MGRTRVLDSISPASIDHFIFVSIVPVYKNGYNGSKGVINLNDDENFFSASVVEWIRQKHRALGDVCH
jgi:hypothetical protein